jgi:alkanesulfonate monooxygenase SsuD/methylene tetrahydromethanopterin reductase-like flavin-dependent oxidoreductase (luciferase family)
MSGWSRPAEAAPARTAHGGIELERIAVALGAGLSPAQIVNCARTAEQCGYDSAWVVEGHGGDQFTLLTGCALATSRIRLGTAISSVFVRTPPTVAMAASCVDHFSHGRFVLGLGSSHKVQVEPEHGVVYTKPLERVRDYRTGARKCHLRRNRQAPALAPDHQARHHHRWLSPQGR